MQIVLPNYATRFDPLSMSACFLSLKGVGAEPRHATGFLWRKNAQIFLITNWHVVTCINIMDGTALAQGWCPEQLSVEYWVKQNSGQPPDMTSIEFPTFEVPLYVNFHEPHWHQHSMTFEWNVDVIAIRVDQFMQDTNLVQCANDYQYPNLYHFAGSEIFVLGHPLQKSKGLYPMVIPVWKRGSIASEILIPWNMRPAFLIDCRTSKGMSGSPVFSRMFGPAAHGDGTIKVDNILTSEFMGVYSGRLFDDDNNASLGLVWHRNLIEQILTSPAPGSRDWKPNSLPTVFSTPNQSVKFDLPG